MKDRNWERIVSSLLSMPEYSLSGSIGEAMPEWQGKVAQKPRRDFGAFGQLQVSKILFREEE